MRQREAKLGVDGAAAPWKEQQRSGAGRWPEDAEAAATLGFTARTTKRAPYCSVINVLLAAFMLTVPAMVILLGARTRAPAVRITPADAVRRGVSGERSYDRLLGGLLADGFDERSCRSRYQSVLYRRRPGRQPSAYLVSKLRQHEALQRRCGPGTAAYSHALEQLRSGKSGGNGGVAGSQDCKYLVSISYRGLGNRILAAASAFLYAALTGRVLLVDPSNEMGELFCEPFPGTTWLLPPGFPLASYTNFSVTTAESYGNMLRNKAIRTDAAAAGGGGGGEVPAFAYVHLDHDATEQDNLFFCDEDQRVLGNVPWLVMRTDNYFVPGLFLDTGFRDELARMFPEPDAAFHHVVRYLFHPNNHVWGLVTRYHDAYLAGAAHRVGIQVRVFGAQPNSPELLEQITRCTQKEGLLPELLLPAAAGDGDGDPDVAEAAGPSRKTKAVLVTSLKSWYYEKLKGMYWERAAATGEAVGVHQPSHEEFQRFGARSHDAKALAEMHLLSLTDALVTTAWSTFGYVAQGLGGLRPWVMYRPENDTHVPDPPCGRDVSMDPCFHAPPFYDCRLKRGADTGKIVPQVRHCIDMSWGLKIVHPS
ncbi:unnamed protein product [Urochloa humidicola]